MPSHTSLATATVIVTVAAVLTMSSQSSPPLSAQGAVGAPLAGTWYLELDVEPFGLPPGIVLPALLTLHADGTLMLLDSGDFGAQPINLVQSPQLGSWARTGGRSLAATTLFFAGDPVTLDAIAVKRVRLRLALADNQSDRLVGVAEVVEQLDCPPGPLPSFLSCPNPVTAPDGDWLPEPGGAPNVPLRAWRVTAR